MSDSVQHVLDGLDRLQANDPELLEMQIRVDHLPLKLTTQLMRTLATNSTLTTLDIAVNKIAPSRILLLGKALEQNTTLTTLNLNKCQIFSNGACIIGKALETNATLTSLRLRHNEIDEGGAWALTCALRTNATLTELDLGDNRIEPDDACGFDQVLRTSTVLKKLVLDHNRIAANGLNAIIETLETNTTLTWLDLSHNHIDEDVLIKLGRSLEHNSTLTALDIASYGRSSGVAERAIAKALVKNTTLVRFLCACSNPDIRRFVDANARLAKERHAFMRCWVRAQRASDPRAPLFDLPKELAGVITRSVRRVVYDNYHYHRIASETLRHICLTSASMKDSPLTKFYQDVPVHGEKRTSSDAQLPPPPAHRRN